MKIDVFRLRPGDGGRAQLLVGLFCDEKASVGHLESFLAESHNILISAEVDGSVAGFVLAYRLDRIKDETCKVFIYEIEVLARFRRHGVGSALIHKIREIAGNEGAINAFGITNRSFKGAIEFYEDNGARLLGNDAVLVVFEPPVTDPKS